MFYEYNAGLTFGFSQQETSNFSNASEHGSISKILRSFIVILKPPTEKWVV